jgi:DNA-binding transcriptional regulator LsrR (DeoR family)
MDSKFVYSEQNRTIAKILKLHYMENFSQAEVAHKLGLSPVKVTRLLKIARQAGMIEINIRLPYTNLYELETRLQAVSNLKEVIVTPSIDDLPDGDLSLISQAAASHLISQIRPKGSICLGGGRTLVESINKIDYQKIPGVRILPAIGGVQRDPKRDVNSLSNQLAERLGGEAIQFYAPAFAETEEERMTIYQLTHVIRALELARRASIGFFGIGTLQIDSSIIQYCSLPYNKLSEMVKKSNGVGEILGYVIDAQGNECIPEVSNLVIGISLKELFQIPVRIGVAAGSHKALSIAAVIRKNYFTNLVLDENAARGVLAILEKDSLEPDIYSQPSTELIGSR